MRFKKFIKFLNILFVALIILLLLFFPTKRYAYLDGGTVVYEAIALKIVVWRDIGGYKTTSFYVFPDNLKSIEELSYNR